MHLLNYVHMCPRAVGDKPLDFSENNETIVRDNTIWMACTLKAQNTKVQSTEKHMLSEIFPTLASLSLKLNAIKEVPPSSADSAMQIDYQNGICRFLAAACAYGSTAAPPRNLCASW